MNTSESTGATDPRTIACSLWVLFLGVSSVLLFAQSTPPRKLDCFSIHVRLNGGPVDGPQLITLRNWHNDVPLPLEEGCFKVPPALLAGKTLDVDFKLPGNRIYLVQISTTLLKGSWDIDLADKKFEEEVRLPKLTRPKKHVWLFSMSGVIPNRCTYRAGVVFLMVRNECW